MAQAHEPAAPRSSSRIYADMDPLRERLGLRSRRAPLTPSPIGGPTPPSQPPAPGPPAKVAARPAPGAAPTRRAEGASPPRAPRQGSALTAIEETADAATEGVRTLPHSPVAAGFGVAQRLVSSGRGAARSAARRRSLALSLRPRGPRLIIAPTLFEAGFQKSGPPLLVSDEEEPDGPAGVGGGGDTPDDPDVGRDWHPDRGARRSKGRR